MLVIAGEKQALVIGTVAGSAYGMVAMGLVLIYKSSGVFNFAQGEFGTVALCVLYLLHSNDIPYGFAVIGGLLAAMLFGFVTERVIIRPLFEAPAVTLLVATRGRRTAGSRSSNGSSTTRAVRSRGPSRRSIA